MDTELTRKAEAIQEFKAAMAELAVEYYKAGAIPIGKPIVELAFWFADWGDHWEWRATVPQGAWKMISGDCKAFDRAISAGDSLIKVLKACGEIPWLVSRVKLSAQAARVKERYCVTKLSMMERE